MVASNFLQSISPKCLSHEHFVDKLIRLYRANECLWNPRSSGYHNKALKENAWHRISHFFNDELTVDHLKLTIISLRHLYERERMMRAREKQRENLNTPPHPHQEQCYQKLQFLENTDDIMGNGNTKAIEAHPKLCNSQINCIVEDKFLVTNHSQKSIHSEHVDFGLHLPRNQEEEAAQEYPEIVEFGEKNYAVSFPYPEEIFPKSKALPVRVVSGNDRSYSKTNYNNVEEDYEDFRRRQSYSRTRSGKIKLQRPKSNYSVSSQSERYGNTDDWLPGTAQNSTNQPKRKVLTGRYSKPNSRQRLNDYMYEVKLNEIQHSQYRNTMMLQDVVRKKSGNDGPYDSSGSKRVCGGPKNCSCCPMKDYDEEEETVSYKNRMETIPEELTEEFQSPEPTSEDYRPQKCCRNDTCAVKLGNLRSAKEQDDRYSDRSEQSYKRSNKEEDPRSYQTYRNDNRRRIPELYSQESFNRERQSKRGDSRAASQINSRPISPRQNGSALSQDMKRTLPEPVYYCSRNRNDYDNDNYVECPKANRNRPRQPIEQESEVPPQRLRTSRRYQDEEEDMQNANQRYSNRSNRQRGENPRVAVERYDYEDQNSRRREPEDYSPNRKSDKYSRQRYEPAPEPIQQRSRPQSRSSPNEKFSARSSTKSNQRPYVLDHNVRSGSENFSDEPLESSRQSREPQKFRNYDTRQPIYAVKNDTESCSCLSDERNDTIASPDYAEESIDNYPHSRYNDTDESLEDYDKCCNPDTCNECNRNYDPDYQQRSSKNSRRLQENPTECVRDCAEEVCANYPPIPRQQDYPGEDEDISQEYPAADKPGPCYCDMAVETELDMTLNNRHKSGENIENSSITKPVKPARKPKQLCKCAPQSGNKSKSARSSSATQKSEIQKQRMSNSRSARHQKSEEDPENEFQAYGGQRELKLYQITDAARYHNSRDLYRQASGVETVKKPQDGVAVLGNFQVPPNLAEKTINIVKQHINHMVPSNNSNETPERSSSSTQKSAESSPKVDSNPFRNINFDVSKGQIIILHPPVEDFRPSKYSFSLKDVEVQPKSN